MNLTNNEALLVMSNGKTIYSGNGGFSWIETGVSECNMTPGLLTVLRGLYGLDA